MDQLKSKYAITKPQVLTYLTAVLQNWLHRSPDPTQVLYATYDGAPRMDIYDNSLLANALIMLSDREPHPTAVQILNVFAASVAWLKAHPGGARLIAAAFSTVDWNVPADANQNVGNNAMACMALCKFCLAFPDHSRTPEFKNTVAYIVEVFVSAPLMCPRGVGVQGGWRNGTMDSYVSMEHMIDCFAMSVLAEKLGIQGAAT